MTQPDIHWSDWRPFDSDRDTFRDFPRTPGLYRIRPIGQNRLIYIGQTGRSLRERVRALCLRTLDTEMPFNDPHTAAPNLWAWRQTEGWDYEASVTACDLPGPHRQALECYLLWQYRLKTGESTLANHGRFHPQYSKSRNRASGQRGERLPEGQTNPASGPSLPPLRPEGTPTSPDWLGLDWQQNVPLAPESLSDAPGSPGLYRIIQNGQVVYVGESKDLKARLRTHARAWDSNANCYWVMTPHASHAYQRHELENDLIGSFFRERGTSPELQFRKSPPQSTRMCSL